MRKYQKMTLEKPGGDPRRLNVELYADDIAALWTEIKTRRRIPMKAWMREAIQEKLGRESENPTLLILQGLDEKDLNRARRLARFLRESPERLKRCADLSLEILEDALAQARGDSK